MGKVKSMDLLKPLNIQSDSKFNIFSEMFPDCNAFALIKCYAVVQMIKVICEESGWEYPHAALKNEKNRNRIDQKLNCGWDVSFFDRPDYSVVFKKIYKKLESLSLKDFMRKFLPDWALCSIF